MAQYNSADLFDFKSVAESKGNSNSAYFLLLGEISRYLTFGQQNTFSSLILSLKWPIGFCSFVILSLALKLFGMETYVS